jgi:hypothetical protein
MIDSCNKCVRRSAGKFHAPLIWAAFALAGAAAWPNVAAAQASANPYATVSAEYDSNVFRVNDSPAGIAFAGEPLVGDWDSKQIIGATGQYLWGLQKFTGTLEGRHEVFDHLTDLDHYEYLAKGEFDFKLASLFDGLVSIRQERFMAQFANNQSNTLEINTDRNVVERLNFYATPDWRVEGGASEHTLDSPLKFFPQFADHEIGAHGGLSYLGIANLTYGLSFDHLRGNYSYASGVSPYSQNGGSLHMTYMLNGLSQFEGAVGYAKRDLGPFLGRIDGWTGNLAYDRQLTAKTSIQISGERVIGSYLASGGSEIDTTGKFAVTWHATYKIYATASYAYTHSTFVGQAIPGSVATGRRDHTPSETGNITYDVFRHLQIKGYINRQVRDSTSDFFNYYDTIYGLQVTAHWK